MLNKRLILASNSPQRRNLMKLFGVPFDIIPSQVEEVFDQDQSCSDLVKKNALIKAEDIASSEEEGIVIGSDTLACLSNGQVLGKPKDFNEAKQTIKALFNNPHYIYTGIAVIDAANKTKYVDYEKTKVFMDKLSDDEIDRYHKKVNPLDKAGAFDIEGLGGSFINKIEGCYTNVVGLPLSKLRLMLKRVGVSLLSLLLMISSTGCITQYYNVTTEKQELYFYDTDKEVRIGTAMAQGLEKKYEVNTDIDINKRINEILNRIVEVCDRKELVYFIKVLKKDDIINAVSLPGGYIYLFQDLVDIVESDDELAAVIAHEVGNITARHGIKRLQTMYGAMFLQLVAIQTKSGVAGGVNRAINALFYAHSQADEYLADKLSVKYLKAAGYDPNGIISFLKRLQEEGKKRPLREFSYWRTHPFLSNRIAKANVEITGRMEFKDYIKLTE